MYKCVKTLSVFYSLQQFRGRFTEHELFIVFIYYKYYIGYFAVCMVVLKGDRLW